MNSVLDGESVKKDMVLTEKSFLTTDKTSSDNRAYYFQPPVDGSFAFGAETLKRGCDVQYPIGTTEVTLEQASSHYTHTRSPLINSVMMFRQKQFCSIERFLIIQF